MKTRSRATLVGIVVSLSLSAQSAFAALPDDLSSKFAIDDDDPTASIPSADDRARDPLEFGYFLQDLIARAEGGFLAHDWRKAAKYYEALAKAVPDRAVSFTRLCAAYAELGQYDRAAGNCAHALGLGGVTVADHFRFINVSLKRQQLDARNLADLDASIRHLREYAVAHPATSGSAALGTELAERATAATDAPAASASAPAAPSGARPSFEAARAAALADAARRERQRTTAERAQKAAESAASFPLEIEIAACKVAVRVRDRGRIDACLQALRGLRADEKVVLPFEWSRALVSGDRGRADELLGRAKALELPDAALRAMNREEGLFFASRGLGGKSGVLTLALLLLALGGGVVAWAIRGSRRRKLEASGPA